MGLGAMGLARRNIRNKPGRAYGLMALTAILCFVLFLSSFLILSLKNGIHSLSGRMGADLIVVPEGYDSKITGAILRGEPNSFFFDQSVAERVRALPGVEEASPQIFLATLSAGCCSYPLQLIGVDFDTDFSVVPWLSSQVKLPLKEGEIIVGASIEGTYNSEVKFFGSREDLQKPEWALILLCLWTWRQREFWPQSFKSFWKLLLRRMRD